MEANKILQLLVGKKETSLGEILFCPELSEDEPLLFRKKLLLEELSYSRKEIKSLNSSFNPCQLKYILDTMLMQERIINLKQIELYFVGVDCSNLVEPVSPRNEHEALHSVIGRTGSSISCDKHNEPLLNWMRNAAVDLIDQLGKKFGEVTTVIRESSCEKENYLLQWGKSNGVNTKLEIAYVQGAGRGAIAIENLKIGDVAFEIPVSLIISEKDILESDMIDNFYMESTFLEKIDDMSSETMLLLWSMKEKHNPDSKYKFYFDSLPEAFNTGLSFGVSAIMALDGTILLEAIMQVKEHLRIQYTKLFPALCKNHPDAFPAKFYTREDFLWACELWYSNSMKIMFEDGKLQTCLVPNAGFLNHSIDNFYMESTFLEKIDDMSSETMLLLWSMKEKHNPDSKYKFYFDSLPEAFNTGLSFGVSAIMALDGTILLEAIMQVKEHLRTQYTKLFPALCKNHPDAFPAKFYTREDFLWACELWYSNSMKIMFEDGKLQTCLVPNAGFLNHSSFCWTFRINEADQDPLLARYERKRKRRNIEMGISEEYADYFVDNVKEYEINYEVNRNLMNEKVEVLVYRFSNLIHPKPRLVVAVNAEENGLSGCAIIFIDMSCCAIIPTGTSIVVVEGPSQSIRKYRRRMKRIHWETNRCSLVWQGCVAQRTFKKFSTHERSRESDAHQWFVDAGVSHYWDRAMNFTEI